MLRAGLVGGLGGAMALGALPQTQTQAQTQAQAQAPSRGELLYQTHCGACHSEKLHWRDTRLATDWASLTAQVRRWQEEAQLRWTEDDIGAVAGHLNAAFYHFSPAPGPQASALRSPAAARARTG